MPSSLATIAAHSLLLATATSRPHAPLLAACDAGTRAVFYVAALHSCVRSWWQGFHDALSVSLMSM